MIRELCEDGPGLLGLQMPAAEVRRALGIRRRPRRACAIVPSYQQNQRRTLSTKALTLIDARGRELHTVSITGGRDWALDLLHREARRLGLRRPEVLAR